MPAARVIVDGERQRIQEHGCGFIEGHAVLAGVGERLGGVPFEILEGLAVHGRSGSRCGLLQHSVEHLDDEGLLGAQYALV